MTERMQAVDRALKKCGSSLSFFENTKALGLLNQFWWREFHEEAKTHAVLPPADVPPQENKLAVHRKNREKKDLRRVP